MFEQEGYRKLEKECIRTGLCFECGACELVCPNGALKLKKYPWFRNPELVADCVKNNCTRCYDACAAAQVPLSEIEKRFFGRTRPHLFPGKSPDLPCEHDEDKTGIVRSFYTGFSTDPEIYEQAVSGGISTSILVHALQSGMIDGAVLAGFDPETPYEAKACVATTREEILRCAGSKYQPHPQLPGIRDALKLGLKNIAVTATPCTILSLRKMMLQDEFDELTSCIRLVIGNICGAHWSRHGTEDLIENWTGVPLSEVKELKYRARPFPGEFQVRTKNGDLNIRSFVNGGGLGQLAKYTPEECRYCLEKAASAADIVVGDTWHHPVLCPTKLDGYTEEDLKRDERIAHARQGMTAVVVRSEAGQRFVDAAIAANAVKLYPETEEGWRAFLCAVHDEGKPKCNGPVIHARLVRKQPVREYF